MLGAPSPVSEDLLAAYAESSYRFFLLYIRAPCSQLISFEVSRTPNQDLILRRGPRSIVNGAPFETMPHSPGLPSDRAPDQITGVEKSWLRQWLWGHHNHRTGPHNRQEEGRTPSAPPRSWVSPCSAQRLSKRRFDIDFHNDHARRQM